MTRAFWKMNGLGNDFVIIDARSDGWLPTPGQIRLISDRRLGIGCDQFITINKPKTPGTDAFLLIYNADGSVAGACGNGTRCIGRLLCEELKKDRVSLQTESDTLDVWRDGALYSVDMGQPRLDWKEIPLAQAMDTAKLDLAVGALREPTAVSMGNPHAVFFIRDVNQVNLTALGPQVEHHPLFPERTNVEVVSVINRQHLRMRVWERGTGITMACGSGACAVLVAAVRRGLTDRKAKITLDGGDLTIAWRDDNRVIMTGPATLVAAGTLSPEMLAEKSQRSAA